MNVNPIVEFLLTVVVFLAGVAGLNLVSVEGIKTLINWMNQLVEDTFLAGLFSKLSLSGRKTFFVSILTAFFLIAGFDMNVFADLSQFGDLDPTYVNLIQGVMAGLLSNYYHDKSTERQATAKAAEYWVEA